MLNLQILDLSAVNSLHAKPISQSPLRAMPSDATDTPASDCSSQSFQKHFDLARVTPLERHTSSGQNTSVFEADPEGAAAVQFRLMQGRLTSRYKDGGTLLITSPAASDGKSLTVHNLAWALAEAGHPTLLLELDLRKPTQAERLRALSPPNIMDVLCGRQTAAEAVRRIDGLPLGFLGAKGSVENVVPTLRSEALQNLLSWAKNNFSWVIVDAPPVLPVADVNELLPNIDLVALVVRHRVTPRQLVQRAAERLGSRLDFTILNDTPILASDGYYSS